jgi:hypothetical protein
MVENCLIPGEYKLLIIVDNKECKSSKTISSGAFPARRHCPSVNEIYNNYYKKPCLATPCSMIMQMEAHIICKFASVCAGWAKE